MDSVGIVVVALVLVVALVGGLWWKRSNGRLRDVPVDSSVPVDNGGKLSDPPGLLVPTQEGAGLAAGLPLDPAVLAGLGVDPGERATLLQFSSAYCAPCRAVSRISSEVAGEIPGVHHVEVDAEEHFDAVKALGIWRTPTLLVLDREGRVVKRATGVPKKPQLIAAVRETL
jgi:thiol-disulfide isomerase/thioredoxin